MARKGKGNSTTNKHGFPILRNAPKPRLEPVPRRSLWMQDKDEIYKKTNCQCWYCGTKLTPQNRTIDHIIPWAKGGTDHELNLIGACKSCNELKRDSTLEQFRRFLEQRFKTTNFKFWGEMQIFKQKS